MFSKLQAHNFLSWAELEFDFTSGVTLLEGFNHDEGTSEGSGKSSVPNALCWVLYGKLPKEARVDEVIKEGERGCQVTVELENGHLIGRSRNPNDVWITRGVEVIKGKDAKETQLLIDELVGMSFDTFCQSVYFAQNYPNKFVTANEEQKSKILSEILNIKVFDAARKLVMDELRGTSGEYANIQRDLRAKEILLNSHREGALSLKEEVDRFDADKKDQLSRIEYGLSQFHAQLSEEEFLLREAVKKLQDEDSFNEWAQTEENCLNDLAESIAGQLGSYKQAVANRDRLKRELNLRATESTRADAALDRAQNHVDACPSCKRPFDSDPEAKNELLTELAGKLEEAEKSMLLVQREYDQCVVPDVTDLKEQQLDIAKHRHRLQQERQNFAKEQAAVRSLERRVDTTKAQIASTEQHHQQVTNTSNEVTRKKLKTAQAQVGRTAEELMVLQGQEKKIAARISNLETLKQAFREVKSYVFREVLAELSRKTNGYLEELFNVPVHVQFTNSGDDGEMSKIQANATINGIERPLGLYSGGQFRRLQLAIDLALSDIVAGRGTKPVGLRVFDEACKDLSATSMETVVRLLERLKGSTIVVEHNELIKSAVSRVFKVELRDGTSYAAGDNSVL